MIDGHSHPQDVIRGVRHEGQIVVLEVGGEIDMKSSVELNGESYRFKQSVGKGKNKRK